jgi:iron complex transport system substrate-binding protein
MRQAMASFLGIARRLLLCAGVLLPVQQAALAQQPPKRIVTLGGDITEIVYRLGAGDKLVGRDTTSAFPPEAEKLLDVGYFRQLSGEGLLSLKPDLIIASASAGPPEVLQQIASAGVKIVKLPEGQSEAGLLHKIETIAAALGIGGEGARLSRQIQAELSKTKSAVAALSGRPKVLFIINEGGGAPMAAGRETAADAIIALANAENVFSSHKGYKAISLEAAAAVAPEAIALMDHSLKSMGGVEGVASNPALRLTPAARNGRIFARNGSYLLGFGPRLPKAILDFARAIRGQGQS